MGRDLSVNLLALFLAVTGPAPTSAQQPQKPNVVFILADNVGYGKGGSRLYAPKLLMGTLIEHARSCCIV